MNETPGEADYEPVQAKFCASLLWFVCRISENGYGDIPPEITSPLEITITNAFVVRPTVVDYLTSGVMYLRVGSRLYNNEVRTLWDLLQTMSHNGMYVMDKNDEAVTDQDLKEKFPFKLSAHLAIMDAIMLVYSNNLVSVEHVVNAVRKFSTFNASKELPFDLEDALLLWMNKVNQANMAEYWKLKGKNHPHPGGGEKTFRFRKDQLIEKKVFPRINDLGECIKDGTTLLSILLFYFPGYVQVNSINLASVVKEEDKIDSIERFRSLCAECVCTSVFALRVEDFLYASEHLKNNFLALLCEMFSRVEIEKQIIYPSEPSTLLNSDNKVSSSNQVVLDDVDDIETTHRHQSEISRAKGTQHQPLLSKRSRKQLAKFETELSQDLPRNTALQLDDLDLKQSQTVPSTVNKNQLHTISHAWEANLPSNDDTKFQKHEKISIDFRPESSSFPRASIRSHPSDIDNTEGSTATTYGATLLLTCCYDEPCL